MKHENCKRCNGRCLTDKIECISCYEENHNLKGKGESSNINIFEVLRNQ